MEQIRLQKFLADCGVASRRASEEHILNGRVKVNGKTVTQLGTKVSSADKVEFDGKVVTAEEKKIYIMLNKPQGYLSTAFDERGRKTVIDLTKEEIKERIFPVGRLDYDTEGLLLLTNDGELTNKLTHPRHEVGKTYLLELNNTPHPKAVEKLRRGVVIDGKKTLPAEVDWIKDNILKITIKEGRNRQIRKMAEAVGYEVEYLKRISIGMVQLGNLPLGRWRHLTKVELTYLKGL